MIEEKEFSLAVFRSFSSMIKTFIHVRNQGVSETVKKYLKNVKSFIFTPQCVLVFKNVAKESCGD